ncbi:MAG: hypothetical protein ACRD23_13595 [Terriglobales bacterium]
MSIAPTPQDATLQESDLLVPFESQNIPNEYKEYYKTKRNNCSPRFKDSRECGDTTFCATKYGFGVFVVGRSPSSGR